MIKLSINFSFTIILQNLAQLKSLFKDDWESIMGNCDSFVYLGGNEQSSHKYVSELLGKETIDIRNTSQSKGKQGSFSTNDQTAGRELLTPDEVRKLNNDYSIVFIRGSDPVIDKKYDVWNHPNAKYSTLKGGEPYDDSGKQFLKEHTYSSSVEKVEDEENFDGLIIDLDQFIDDVEEEIENIRRKNYLL